MIYLFIYGIVAVFLILYFLIVVKKRNKMQGSEVEKFLQDNPNAIRFYSSKSSTIGYLVADFLKVFYDIFIESVNGEYPARFSEKLGAHYGVYIKPGKNTFIVVARSKGKKTASSRNYGPLELTIDAQPGKEYVIDFVNREFKVKEI